VPIELKPETEVPIRQDVRRGAYRNETEFVERAAAMLHEQEEWLSTHRGESASAIEAGYASAQRDDLTGEKEVRKRMCARKQEWLVSSRRQV
jgi:Arc/MetJ-type ribon-helix-helix transcriptional regulator